PDAVVVLPAEAAPAPEVTSAFGDSLARDSVHAGFDPRIESLGVAELKPLGDLPTDTTARPASTEHALVDGDDTIDAVDAVDAELFPIFEEEAEDLLPQLASRLRDWSRRPTDPAPPAACMRTLHTLKGGARLAGAMRLGEMAHRLETRIERLVAGPTVETIEVEALQSYGDSLAQTFDALRGRAPAPAPEPAPRLADPLAPGAAEAAEEIPSAGDVPATPEPAGAAPKSNLEPEWQPVPDAIPQPAPLHPDTEAAALAALPAEEAERAALEEVLSAEPAPAPPPGVTPAAPIDWSRFPRMAPADRATPERQPIAQSSVRVRAPLLDRLVNQAGEVSIARSRIETGVVQIKTSLGDLTENLERLRAQLRDIEFHGEVQMTSRLEAAKAASQSFDPLEFDRFTRFQELTRMMAESVNDVATVQRSLQRALETAEDELVAQARMTRELQDDLLRTRMVEFEGLSDRLYRVVRQAAKETGKSVRLDILGGSIEVDRGVLDRMTGAFEHLLRNCVTHGIEPPQERLAAGKDTTGTIIVALTHEGNEVGVEFRDDGAGLNLPRIRAKGVALGLIEADAEPTDAELANLIFAPGFSTAETITELAGRGVGMDVVRSEVNAMGGRVETATAAGQGTSFKLILPLTTAVTQVVMMRCGETHIAVPSTLVEVVRRAAPAEVDAAYAQGAFPVGDRLLPFFWLGALLQVSVRPAASEARMRAVVVIRSAQQRIALHVDEVLGNQEVVVKNLGPQLSRLPGLAGITLLASGLVALIYNPVALATLYGDSAREATRSALAAPVAQAAVPSGASSTLEPQAPLVMVVDDSLTVRRVTQRLLVREGYRVVLAKDGLDALERLAEAVPQVVLSDIEMPRMDGFDLVRNMRADARLRDLPVIMITSRIAQKHRDYAAELGVDHYLGKPYSEEDLLSLLARYTRASSLA
ncbi:MAG: response regulator, partial [Pseudomonadota bacterium]|nr:response regulator [Pseudomonadota bacterium]